MQALHPVHVSKSKSRMRGFRDSVLNNYIFSWFPASPYCYKGSVDSKGGDGVKRGLRPLR